MKKILLLFYAISPACFSQVPELVKDINVITPNSNAVPYISFNNELYFSQQGTQALYKTNGTSAGTILVKLLTAGNGAGLVVSSNSIDYTVANNNMFFCASVTGSRTTLWKTDGTSTGTVPVKEVTGVTNFNSISSIRLGDLIFFKRGSSSLWRSDGTDAGTFELFANYSNIFIAGSTLYITGTSAANGLELFTSDGTVAGTVLLKDINPGTSGSSPVYFGTIGNEIFFTANDGTNGNELWKSDGTTTGTVMVKDISPGSLSSIGVINAGKIGNELFFIAAEPVNGAELWKTDGTTAGTVMVKNIAAGGSGSNIGPMTLFNNELYFSADDVTAGAELWKTNGTEAGTVMVKDINAGAAGSAVTGFNVLNGKLFFNAATADGTELWSSDGSNAGTGLIMDFNPGAASSSPSWVTSVGSDHIFRLTDADGVNLWRTDGTTANTVKINVPGVANPNPSSLNTIALNDRILFTATSALGQELYYTNAANTEATLVKDIYPGASTGVPATVSGFINRIVQVNGKAVFTGSTFETGTEPWITDGTEAGTFMLKDIAAVSNASNPTTGFPFAGNIYFSATDGIAGNELWKSDGTNAGTVLVKDIQAGSNGQGVFNFCSNNGLLFFSGASTSTNRELWVTDGTASGTIEIPVNPSPTGSSAPASLVSYNNNVYFFANNGTNYIELHKTDGTAAGTAMVKDASILTSGFTPGPITVFDGKMIYTFNDGANGSEIWTSDGTSGGTLLNQNINANAGAGSNPSNFTVAGNQLFFTATDGATGVELWRMTSTIPGSAQLVKDITVGSSSSTITGLTNVNGTLYFVRSNNQFWKSDGTDAGTVQLLTMPFTTITMVTNVQGELFFVSGGFLFKYDAANNSTINIKNGTVLPANVTNPTNMIVAGNTLYFDATSNYPGTNTPTNLELWKCKKNETVASFIPMSSAGPLPSNFSLLNGYLFFAATDFSNYNRELFKLLLDAALPVNLLYFNGNIQKNNAQLSWKTASEINASHFELQRSSDGVLFNTIANIASGNVNYVYTDTAIFAHKELVFYRLNTIDNDGSSKLSTVVRLQQQKDGNILVYPNPTSANITLSGLEPNTIIQLTDAHGRIVHTQKVIAQSASIDISRYANGIYWLRYTSSLQSGIQKIIKR